MATAELQADAARVFVNDAAVRVEASAKQALAAMLDGDTLRTMLAGTAPAVPPDAHQHGCAAAAARRRGGRKGGYIF